MKKIRDNLISAREKLKEYYFSNNRFSKGEYVTYINPKYFYDLKITSKVVLLQVLRVIC